MYTNILVPFDGSKRAEAILPHVENLANCFGAKVVLLQVTEPHAILIDGVNPVPDMEEHERHTKIATAYLAHRTGQPQEKGIEVKAQVAHGRTGLAQVFYGSVAAGVLHLIDRPLLLVRAKPG